MLINFTVSHYRSFGAEQTLNMLATALKDHPGHCVPIPLTDQNVLQIGVIYGANASGKSNLIKAMLFAQFMVIGTIKLGRLVFEQFRFLTKQQPASFEFRFLAQGQVFVYGFTAARDEVIEEWLDASSKTGREIPIFSRKKQEIKIGKLKPFGEDAAVLRRALNALKLLGIRADQLLLNRIAELPDAHRGEILTRAVWWFSQCLQIVQSEAQFTNLLDLLSGDEKFRAFCGAFLDNVGTGIKSLQVELNKINASQVPKTLLEQLQSPKGEDVTISVGGVGLTYELDPHEPTKIIRKNLTAKHRINATDYPIPFHEESDGTQRCLNLLPALYHLTRESKVYVVDEIDRSLHPLLCHSLLKLFLDACPGGCQQMIVTTHETHLLDLELLRRDEIWFLEKDLDQQTRLSSLSRWRPRNDLRIEKGYLQGRFGGIPFIGDTQKLMDMIQRPTGGKTHAKKTPS